MEKPKNIWILAAGVLAGAANGFFGAGGGMLLVPLLSLSAAIPEESIFPVSVSITLPITVTTLFIGWQAHPINLGEVLPYLVGSLVGGFIAGHWGKRVPIKWLHRGLGILILWGGVRYLW